MNEVTNNLKDIKGKKIEAGQNLIYVNNPKTIFTVVADNKGNIGHTVKFKNSRMTYQSFLRFLPKDDLKTFEIL